jgi:YNFM family putative membrane transporter
MSDAAVALGLSRTEPRSSGVVLRTIVIGLTAFLGTSEGRKNRLGREQVDDGPSIVTTLWAGRAVHRYGTRPALWASLALAGAGLPLLVLPDRAAVLLGMVLVAVGTFFAQATATGFVSRAATADRGAASGIYLACYFAGGIVGTAILGQIFDRIDWPACVAGISLALAADAILASHLKTHP